MAREVSPGIDRDGRSILVGLVDLALIAAVIGFGMRQHGGDPIHQPVEFALVVLPFWIGWVLVGTIAGAYATPAYARLGRGAWTTAAGWIGGALIGSLLRASSLFPGDAPPIFVLVVTSAGLAVLLPWRLAGSLLNDKL